MNSVKQNNSSELIEAVELTMNATERFISNRIREAKRAFLEKIEDAGGTCDGTLAVQAMDDLKAILEGEINSLSCNRDYFAGLLSNKK